MLFTAGVSTGFVLESYALVGRRVDGWWSFLHTCILAFHGVGGSPGLDVGVWRDKNFTAQWFTAYEVK